ncbi:asparagine synthase (glutamine-hydrolyzing) [uncultured Desulfobulbus sp.]|uniref:asparagine synthase (glutamine-hydrolyzing) n=1 Tax=uncultured Desulfobulbus sp. TaxID=239745 RepID=UPI0029C72E10|nr:asparagine synthase (glutamine-hydrolyzing) [uncultured Desulfobulbus sp.]
MCGIAGVLSLHEIGTHESGRVRLMNQLLEHRGPDSEGIFATNHVILAMRRLSIIDLAGGKQPLFNEARDIAIVCNGEIYNHRVLRADLEALGHHFSSHSDVETIVHAYEEYGVDCLTKLRGMFAFALWDSNNNKLLLARDRMGEKPLYLHRDEMGRLWFSSELRSLRAAMINPPSLTAEAFNLFLTFQYVPEPLAPLAGVAVVPAGHYLELKPGAIDIAPSPYWDLAQVHEDPSRPIAVTEEILDEACRLMGSADVPVAVALSGGIDSSLVAALTSRHYPGQLHAFTIGYKGRPDTDERSFAATLATELGIGFTEVELATEDVIESFPQLIAAMDTPIGDIAAFGYYSVCQAARKAGYPVLLSGMGGDEFFWGYEWVREAVTRNEVLLESKSGKQSWWHRLFGKVTNQTPDFFGVHDELRNGDTWSRALMPLEAQNKLPAGFWLDQASLDLSLPMHLAVSNLLNRTWLRSNCLSLVDRMSMAHSVEVRLPLLDTNLVDRVTGMRNDGLVDWNKPHKWLLVESLRNALPADVLTRKKQGFTPPVLDWMNGIVKRYAPLIADGALVRQGLIDPGRARGDLSVFGLSFLYKLVLLECWVRLHLEGQPSEELIATVKALA